MVAKIGLASGMSERSVRTWRKGPLPSENKVRHRQRTRPVLIWRPILRPLSCEAAPRPRFAAPACWAALTVCRYSSTSSSLSSHEGLKPGTRLVSEWSHFLGKLAISHSTSEKTCSNAISSTGVRRRSPVRGIYGVSANGARMIPCHYLKRRLGRSACDSKSLTREYCGTVDEPNESGREVLMLRYDLTTFAVDAQSDLAVPHHA